MALRDKIQLFILILINKMKIELTVTTKILNETLFQY
jgi:hypothetical protein